MKIVQVASEMFPFIKTGGLADAVGALSSALADNGHDVSVFIPGYRAVASGFPPMDMQVPLTETMMAFQRGAFSPGVQLAYLQYAAVEYLFAANYALGLALVWCWMAQRAQSPLLERSIARGLLFFPLILAAASAADTLMARGSIALWCARRSAGLMLG